MFILRNCITYGVRNMKIGQLIIHFNSKQIILPRSVLSTLRIFLRVGDHNTQFTFIVFEVTVNVITVTYKIMDVDQGFI